MVDFTKINGIKIKVSSVNVSRVGIGEIEKTVGGNFIDSRRDKFRKWDITCTCNSIEERYFLSRMIAGIGHSFTLDTGVTSQTSLHLVNSFSTQIYLHKDNYSYPYSIHVGAGSVIQSQSQMDTTSWTVLCKNKTTSSPWASYGLTSTGHQSINGVSNPSLFLYNGVNVNIVGDVLLGAQSPLNGVVQVDAYYDDVFMLPYAATEQQLNELTSPTSIFAQMPLINLSGDIVENAALGVECIGVVDESLFKKAGYSPTATMIQPINVDTASLDISFTLYEQPSVEKVLLTDLPDPILYMPADSFSTSGLVQKNISKNFNASTLVTQTFDVGPSLESQTATTENAISTTHLRVVDNSFFTQTLSRNAVTVMRWVKTSENVLRYLVYKQNEYTLSINGATGEIVFTVFDSVTGGNIQYSSPLTLTVNDNKWHHVAASYAKVFDGVTDYAVVMFDGAPVTLTRVNTGTFTSLRDTASTFWVGGDGASNWMTSSVAHVAVYGDPLTTSQMRAVYQANINGYRGFNE
jgi:hypothetical protein